MARFLFLLVLAAAAVLPVPAQDYELLIGTKVENGSITDYRSVRDCDVLCSTPRYRDGNMECLFYVKVVNNSTGEKRAVLSLNLFRDYNVYNGSLAVFQACVGGDCRVPSPEAIISFDVPAHSQTPGGPAEHIGFTAIDVTAAEAAAMKFDAECALTFSMGDVTLNVPLLFKDTDTFVASASAIDPQPEYFNLQGMRVSAPRRGDVCIVRQGGRVTKTVIR